MSSASTRFAGDSLAHGDDAGEAEAVWTAAAITVVTTALAAGVAALAAPWVIRDLLHVHGSLFSPAVLGLRILCGALIAQAVAGTLNTSQQIRLKWRSFTLITSGTAVAQVVLIPIALKTIGGGIVTATGVALAMSLACAFGTVVVATRLQPQIRRPRLSRSVAAAMLRYGGAITVSGLAMVPLTTAERLFLGHDTSAAVVGYYVVASRLGALIAAIPAAAIAPLFPALVRLQSSGDADSSRRLYGNALRGTFLVLTPAAIILALVAHPFLALWAGKIYGQRSTTLFYIVLAGVWANSLAYLPTTYLLAVGQAATVARVHVLELAPYLVGAALLTARFGATGAAVVWSARVVLDSVVFFYKATRIGGLPRSPLPVRGARALLMAAVLGASAFMLGLELPGLASRMACGVALLGLYTGATWWAVLTSFERAGVRQLISVGGLGRRRGAGS